MLKTKTKTKATAKTLAIFGLCAALSGCMTPEQIVAYHAQECATLGYKPGSQAHTECTERGYRQTQAANAAAGQAVLEGLIDYAVYDAIW